MEPDIPTFVPYVSLGFARRTEGGFYIFDDVHRRL